MAHDAKHAPGTASAQQAEAVRNVWQKMPAAMKGIADMAPTTRADAVAGVTTRATQNMQNMQAMQPSVLLR